LSHGHARAAAALLLLCPLAARADDVHLDADTAVQAYEVRSPGAGAIMARRRLLQTLGLSWTRELDADRGEPLPRVQASLRLRLDQDFGDTCLVGRDLCVRATDPREPGTYQPLASDTVVDAPEAWAGIGGLPWGASARVGRQLWADPIGLARLDGVTVGAEPDDWIAARAYGGAMVRTTSLAGSGAFEPQGALRLDLDDVDPARVPYADAPTTTWLAGGDVELGMARFVRGSIGFREVWEDAGIVARRGALSLASSPVGWLRVAADGVWDLLDQELIAASAAIDVRVVEPLHITLEAQRRVPRFDLGTIWAYFDVAPITEGRIATRWRPTERFELGGGARLRRASLPGAGDESDAGLEGHLATQALGVRFSLAGFVWGGDLGPLASVAIAAERHITPWAGVEVQLSAWHFDDRSRQGLYGTSLSDAIAGVLRLSDSTKVRLVFDHAHNRVVGHRFRVLAHLQVELWR